MNQLIAPPDAKHDPGADRAKVFVSYSRRDLVFAQSLVADLAALGFEAFLDKTDIAPGEPWQERLAALIASADTVVFVVGPASCGSKVCAWELEESARLGKRVLPLVAHRVPDSDVPAPLGRLNFIFCTETDDRAAALALLGQALRTDLPWVREHTRLGELARRWDGRGRANAATLRGSDLEAAERWLDQRPADATLPTQVHQDFIRASRRGATGRQRAWVGGALAVALVAVGLAVFAELSRRDAQAQRVLADAAKTEAQRQRDAAVVAEREAQAQRDRAERALEKAIHAGETLIFTLADQFRNRTGMPRSLVKAILDPALKLQDDLIGGGETAPLLRRNQSVALNEVAMTLQTTGDVAGAIAAARKSRGIMLALTEEQPGNVGWRRDLAVALDLLGDVELKGGNLAGARSAYEKELAIAMAFATADASPEDKRSVSIVLDKVANVRLQSGDRAGALALYEDSLAIRRILAEQVGGAQAGSDLIVSLSKIGAVQLDGGDRVKARAAYTESLAIARHLAKDATNARAQRDLLVALDAVGSMTLKDGDLAGARATFAEALAVARALAVDTSNMLAQRDLGSVLERIGDLEREAGRRADALAAYGESLAIRRRLAKDRRNAWVRRDVVISLTRIAGLKFEAGDHAGALADYAEGLAVRRTLAADKEDIPAQRDLAMGLDKLGDARRRTGDTAGAVAALRESLAILRTIGSKDSHTAADLADVAYDLTLSGAFGTALEAADLSIAAGSELWLKVNRAHALMFLGRIPEARELYLAHRGKPAHGKKSWDAIVRADFAELREAGMKHPLMGEVEAALATARR